MAVTTAAILDLVEIGSRRTLVSPSLWVALAGNRTGLRFGSGSTGRVLRHGIDARSVDRVGKMVGSHSWGTRHSHQQRCSKHRGQNSLRSAQCPSSLASLPCKAITHIRTV